MDKKFMKIIVGVFVVLAAIASFPWIDEKFFSAPKEDLANVSVNLSGFTKQSVSQIVIKKGDDEKKLVFSGGSWRIGEIEADEAKIADLFDDFKEMEIKETAAKNENSYAKFEVTKETGYALSIWQDGKENMFFVGKSGFSGNDFYMRKNGIKNTFLVSGNLREKLGWTADKWKKTEEKEETMVQ